MSEPITREEVQELINSTVSGLAARQEKQFQKMLTPISEQVTGFGTAFEEFRQQPKPEQKKGDNTPAPDPKIAVLERQLGELKAANEASQAKAVKAERDNALSKVLGTYTFANDLSRDTAFKVFSSDIQMTGDGLYVIGDEPLDAAVKNRMSQLTGLLAPKQMGGSGASSATSAGTTPNLEIRPGMKREELEAAGAELAKLLPR